MANRQADLSIAGTMGSRLRHARENCGLNQRDLASVGGVSLGSQNRYEQGENLPPVDYLLKLGEYGIDWHWIVTGQHAAESLLPADNALLELAVRLPPAFKAALFRIAHDMTALATGQELAPVPVRLPSATKLAAAIGPVLDLYADLDRDELAQALATQLPSVLEAAEGPPVELDPAGADRPQADREAPAPDGRVSKRARRS